MEHLKSLASFELGLIEALLQDARNYFPSRARLFARDLETIRHRVAGEGVAFLSHACSALGKAVDRAFTSGTFVCPTHFKKQKRSALPLFLGGLLQEIFLLDGSLRPDAEAYTIRLTRQILYCFSKYRLPASKAQEESAIGSFLQCNDTCRADPTQGLHTAEFVGVLDGARAIITRVFSRFNPQEIVPRHGPGAVATGEKGDLKWRFSRVYSAIADVYPTREYFFLSERHLEDCAAAFDALHPEWLSISKMCLVPKDYRGPRVINEEPLEVQWIQQGLRRAMYQHIEAHPLTTTRVNFRDQSVNQELARRGSKDSSVATLDMKDASNRVATWLVANLFSGVPALCSALMATRSQAVALPNGETIRLAMFAPMGSAVCFAVESVIFFALAVSAIAYEEDISFASAAEMVHVYGDDLAIDTRVVRHVLRHLPRYNLVFNRDKCFAAGPFRESCGLDAFKGESVEPVRIKEVWQCNKRLQGTQLIAFVESANNFYFHGLWQAASFLREQVEQRSRIKLPLVHYTSSCTLAWRSFIPGSVLHVPTRFCKVRWNTDTQKVEYLMPAVISRTTKSTLDGWSAVLRALVVGGEASLDAVPQSATIKLRWTSGE